MSECDRYLEMISQLVDGELPEPQKTELLAHLDGCANCRRVYDAFNAISLSLGETAAPEGFAEGVMAAVRTQGGHGSRRAKKPGKSQVRYMALAAVQEDKVGHPAKAVLFALPLAGFVLLEPPADHFPHGAVVILPGDGLDFELPVGRL